MNVYCTVDEFKAQVATPLTDFEILILLTAGSRSVDEHTGRFFWTKDDTYYFDTTPSSTSLTFYPDLLSLATWHTDTSYDQTYASEWMHGSDFFLEEQSRVVKTQLVKSSCTDMRIAFGCEVIHYHRAVGTWGYGDGESVIPWREIGIDITVADTTNTEITLSADSVLEAGHTIMVDSEQMFVYSVNNIALTAEVVRGVNETVAATHTDVGALKALYPASVKTAVVWIAKSMFDKIQAGVYSSEQIADYSYKIASQETNNLVVGSMLTDVTRV